MKRRIKEWFKKNEIEFEAWYLVLTSIVAIELTVIMLIALNWLAR